MRFEVVNDKNETIMHTEHLCCTPDKDTLNAIVKAGYKLKLNGKTTTVNKLLKEFKETQNDQNN